MLIRVTNLAVLGSLGTRPAIPWIGYRSIAAHQTKLHADIGQV